MFVQMVDILAQYGLLMAPNESMARIFLIQTLQIVLSTADSKTACVLQRADWVDLVTEFLVNTCRTAGTDLLVISHALDAIFDIYSENFYDAQLRKFQVVPLMGASVVGLQQLFQKAKQGKGLAKTDRKTIESAMANLPAFVEYKVKEMGL